MPRAMRITRKCLTLHVVKSAGAIKRIQGKHARTTNAEFCNSNSFYRESWLPSLAAHLLRFNSPKKKKKKTVTHVINRYRRDVTDITSSSKNALDLWQKGLVNNDQFGCFAKLIYFFSYYAPSFQRHDRDFNLGRYILPLYIQVRVFDDFARTIVYEDLEAPPEALTITCPSRLALHPPLATLHRTRCTGATLRLTLSVMDQLSRHRMRTTSFIAFRPEVIICHGRRRRRAGQRRSRDSR